MVSKASTPERLLFASIILMAIGVWVCVALLWWPFL